MNMSAHIPSAVPVTVPVIKRTGAIYLVFDPNSMNCATISCAALLASAPARLSPTVPSSFVCLNKDQSAIIAIALANDPAAEKTNMYENNVPEIKPCPRILRRTRRNVSRRRIFLSERRTGRFARPSLRNGSGLGIAYSTAERKRQRAAKKEMSLIRSLSMRIVYHTHSYSTRTVFSLYCIA